MKESQMYGCSGDQIRPIGLIIPLNRAKVFLAWGSKFLFKKLKNPLFRATLSPFPTRAGVRGPPVTAQALWIRERRNLLRPHCQSDLGGADATGRVPPCAGNLLPGIAAVSPASQPNTAHYSKTGEKTPKAQANPFQYHKFRSADEDLAKIPARRPVRALSAGTA